MDTIIAVLASGTLRRLLITGVGLLIPILNKKFGWNISDAGVASEVPLVLGYIWQSLNNEKHAREVAAQAAAAVVTPADAAKELAKPGEVPK